jgi:C_GCAxxG_C_C family probable redox protein
MAPKSKAEAVKTAREKALEAMRETNSCAYSTMRALQDTFDLQDESLLKASGALTGGIGGMADNCGSMISSALIIGSVCGCGRDEGDKTIDKIHYSMDRAREFYAWFKEQKGCTSCGQILTANAGGAHYDFTDRQQIIAAIEAGVWEELHKKGRGIGYQL